MQREPRSTGGCSPLREHPRVRGQGLLLTPVQDAGLRRPGFKPVRAALAKQETTSHPSPVSTPCVLGVMLAWRGLPWPGRWRQVQEAAHRP